MGKNTWPSIAQLVGLLSHKTNGQGYGLNSWLLDMPKLQVFSQLGCVREATN